MNQEQKLISEIVLNSFWANNPVYIIGGGSSLRSFNFDSIHGQITLAVNDSFLFLPWVTSLFSVDTTWIKNRKESIERFSGDVCLAVPENFDMTQGPSNAMYVRRGRTEPGFSEDPTTIHIGGGNSGFGAINYAILKGAKKIILLGFDFKVLTDWHWHGNYEWEGSFNSKMYSNWATRLNEQAEYLLNKGIEVLNASPSGALKAFPTVRLGDLPL